MTEQDKQLLLKDLCARLPYEVKIEVKDWVILDTGLKIGHIQRLQNDEIEVKPYLRPMSSMTEEERDELLNLRTEMNTHKHPWIDRVLDFYLSHHLDWRGLILLGLALEAPADMYKTE